MNRSLHNMAVVTVETPNFNDLAWSVLCRLYPLGESPGLDQAIEAIARLMLRRLPAGLTTYLNPAFTVRQIPGCDDTGFLREAQRARLGWFNQLKQGLGSSRLVKREITKASPLIRQLVYTGVLIIRGKHTHPQHWPPPQQEVGQKNT